MQEKTWGDYQDFLMQGLDECMNNPLKKKEMEIFVPIFKNYLEMRCAEFLEEIYGKDTMRLMRGGTE